MRSLRLAPAFLAPVVAVLVLPACSSSNGAGDATGGSAGGPPDAAAGAGGSTFGLGGSGGGAGGGRGGSSGGNAGQSGPDSKPTTGGAAGSTADASCGGADGGAGGDAGAGTGGQSTGGVGGTSAASGGTATGGAGQGGESGKSGVGGSGFGGAAGVGDAPASAGSDGGPGADGSPDAPDGLAACASNILSLQALWPLPSPLTTSAVAVDGQGNVYLAGSFQGSAAFGPVTLTSAGRQDMFVAKFDPTGAVVYAHRYGGNDWDLDTPTLTVDDAGNAYLGGAFGQTLDFGDGTTPLVALTSDGFVAKIDPTGKSVWAKRFGWDGETWSGGGANMVYSIGIAPGGDPVIGGVVSGTITLGSTTWPGQAGSHQPFVARLKSTDGSVVWSAASGGTFDTDKPLVVVDAEQRTFIAGRYFSGAGAWGTGTGGSFRVGFDPSGKPLWSRFDGADVPGGVAIDAAGRLVVIESTLSSTPVTIQTVTFPGGYSSFVLLFSPIDGSLLSGAQLTPSSPNGLAVDRRGNSLVVGTYWDSLIWGNTSLPRSGDHPFFLAAVDGTSQPAGLAGVANTAGPPSEGEPYGMALDPTGTGKIYVPIVLEASTNPALGQIAGGTYIAVFGPDTCVTGGGPQGSATGDPADHGNLPGDGGVPITPPDSGTPGPCPAAETLAVNGATCPVKRGCGYGSDCCICEPVACHGQPTLWTCTTLAPPDPGCPATPPANGSSCSTLQLECTYCATGGRQLATCTAAGWQSGFAQVICN
jgi:hypothetical protein